MITFKVAMRFWRIPILAVLVLTGMVWSESSGLYSSGRGELLGVQTWSESGVTWVTVELSKEVSFSRGSLTSPDRVYFDLYETVVSKGIRSSTDVDDSHLVRVRVGQNTPEVSRVVLDLKGRVPESYFVVQEPTRLVIGLGERASVDRFNELTRGSKATPSGTSSRQVRRVSQSPVSMGYGSRFSSGSRTTARSVLTGFHTFAGKGQTEVQIDWSGTALLADGRLSRPNRVYFDLANTELPKSLENREFEINGLILKKIRVGRPEPTIARVAFELEEGVEHSVRKTSDPLGFRVVFREGFSADQTITQDTGSQIDEVLSVSDSVTECGDTPCEPYAAETSVAAATLTGIESVELSGPSSEHEEVADSSHASTRVVTGSKGVDTSREVFSGEITPADLKWIDELEMRLTGAELGSARNTQGLAAIVNPFKVRKRGRFYGSVYEYHRNDNFDARNFFDPVGEPLPEFKRNQFGASFGSLLSNKLSVFGTYDGLRIIRGSTILSHIPTPEMKAGDFGGIADPILDPFTGEFFENNLIPEQMIHPVSRKMLPTIPNPNREDIKRNFVNNFPEIENQNSFTGRVDYEFSEDTKLFGRYSLQEADGSRPTELPAFGTTRDSSRHSFSLDLSKNFGPQLIGSFQLNIGRTTSLQLSKNVGNTGLLESLGISGVGTQDELDEGYPSFNISGYASLGLFQNDKAPEGYVRNDFQLEGAVTYTPQNHQFSIAGQIGHTQVNNNRSRGRQRGLFGFSGVFTGDGFADFLLGIPDTALHGVGADRGDFRSNSWRISVLDDWRVNKKLSVTLSLAYNYSSPTRSIHDNVSLFWPLLFDPVEGELVTMGSPRAEELGLVGLGPGESAYPDRNNWAPGIGLAYSPLGNKRLVIRSSYEIRYSLADLREAQKYLARNYPFFYYEAADAPPGVPTLDLSAPFAASTPAELTVQEMDPFNRSAYTQQWRVTVQNEIVRNWTVELAYQGLKATHLNLEYPANVPLPGPGPVQERRPNPVFGQFDISTGGGAAVGHLFNAGFQKRLSSGFSVRAGFTLDRTYSDVFRRDPSNPRNLRAERALVDSPSTRFYLNYIYDLPLGPDRLISTAWAGMFAGLFEGWRLSGITNIQGGYKLNPVIKGDFNNDGVTQDRPDRIGPGILPSNERSIDRWFATEDFILPAPYSFGNSGRNILLSPELQVWDISLIKRTPLFREGHILEFRVQLFNAFNNVNFEAPETTFGNDTFGQIFNAGEAREIELALKYSF